MSGWATVLVSIAGSILAAGGVGVAIANGLFRRPVTKVEAATLLSDAALELVEAVKADSAGARHDAREARLEAHQARVEMAEVKRQAEALAQDLRRLRLAILDPYATLDRLRAMVEPAGENAGPVIPI